LYNDGFTIHGAKNRLEELDSQWQIRSELEALLSLLTVPVKQSPQSN
jgi:hypothetical protein